MKRILSIFGLVLFLMFCLAEVALAISVTATPPTVRVGDNVLVSVTSAPLAVANPCQIFVNFGDATSSLINCPVGSVCIGNLNHVYSAVGNYTITASESGTCSAAASFPPGADTVAVTCPILTITTATLPPATVGQPYSTQLFSSGAIPPVTWSNTAGGLLSAGLQLSTNGQIFGTPAETFSGPVSVAATDSCSPPSLTEKLLPLSVSCPPLNIATASLPGGTVGQPFSAQLVASGGVAPISWQLAAGSPPLPAGLTLSPGGLISGTPTAAGVSTVNVGAQDSCAPVPSTITRTLSVNILPQPASCPPLSVATASLPGGTVGQPYSAQLVAGGGVAPISWQLAAGSPPLPAGLTLSPSGLISGNPTAAGVSTVNVGAQDSCTPVPSTITRTLSVNILPQPASCPPLSVATASLPGGTIGQPYSVQLVAGGGVAPISWQLAAGSPPLPAGLTLSPGGLISGTPTAAGVSTVNVGAQDSCAPVPSNITRTLSVNLLPQPANCPPLNVATASLPGGTVGQPYSVQLVASGGVTPISWQLAAGSPPLPAGLTLSPGGLISGTPTTYVVSTINVVAQDSCTPAPSQVTTAISVDIASPATTELTITRIQLHFDNGRAETTVDRNQPGLRVNADLRFDGSGLLKGYWEVDGRVLSQVNQHLIYGKSIRLTSPDVPSLPTFVEGSHRVRLVVTSPENDIPFPEAIYYVTSKESTAGLVPLRVTEPRNHAQLSFATQSFIWENPGKATIFLVEFFEKEGEDPVAAAYTKGTSYDMPESILTDNFTAGKTYSWWVKGYDDEGTLVGASELSHFIFK